MANITDECRTARETATSVTNLVTTSAVSDGVDTLARVVDYLCSRSIVFLETRLCDPPALSICGTCYLGNLKFKIIRIKWSIQLKCADRSRFCYRFEDHCHFLYMREQREKKRESMSAVQVRISSNCYYSLIYLLLFV